MTEAPQESVIRLGTPDDDEFVANAFEQMWLAIGVAQDALVADTHQRARDFVAAARRKFAFRSFIAEVDGRPIGSAACQEFAGLYPNVLTAGQRRYGYIWGVYVDAVHRRGGVGERLTTACIESLRDDGFSHALLHAAPMGRAIYERLGFAPSNEMRLEL